jgi:hypothetical protein
MVGLAFLLTTALAASSPATAPAGRRTKVAVAELEAGLHGDPKLSHLVTTLVTTELRRRPSLLVTTQDDIKALLGFERQKELLGCAAASCLAEIGGALGVDQMVTGSLSHVGGNQLLVVRLVDVHKGVVLREVSRRLPGGTEEASETALLDGLPGVAAELYPGALPEVAPAAVSAEVHGQAAPARSNAPWWLVGAGAVLGVAGGTTTAVEFATKQSPVAGTAASYAISQSDAQTANTVAYVGQAALYVGAALLVGGGSWAIFRPSAPEAAP